MFKLYQKLLVLFLLLPVLGMSQNPMTNKIDSLKIELNKSKTDTGAINLLITLSQQYRNKGYIHLSEKTIQQAISLAKKINHKKALGNGYFAMGWIKQYSGDYDVAQKYYVQALGIQESINDDKGLAVTLTAMGIISIRFGNTDKSIKYYQRALSIKKSLRDSIGIAALFNNLAVVYYELEDFDKAIGYMEDARKIYKSIGNNEALGTILFNLGSYYYEKGDIKKGIKYFYEAHETTMKTEDFLSIAMSFNTLSNIYLDQKDYKKALSFNDRAVYYATKNGRIKDMLMDAYETYANIYSTIGNYHKAYKYQKDFMNIKDSIFNLEKSQQVTELAEKYESEKKEKEIELLNKEKEKQAAISSEQNKRKNTIIFSVVGGLILVILFSVFLFNRFRVTNQQKLVIEEKQKEITDSITYAKRLQTAILPPDNFWKKYLPQSFVLYQPKDIVSGDFYWLENVNDLVLFAAADCTGHGVSGAIVSVVCSNALNRTVKEFGITEPAKILNKTRELVLETFAKSESDIKDGMDISLCCLNTNTNELLWSGANNPLWYIRENNLFEIKGDKQPIGQNDNPKPFTTHSIDLQKDDTVYIFTDGYADQFGGEREKKFMYKPLKELLLSIQNKSIDEQQELLHQKFINWKKNTEQTDDVLVIGFKI